MSRKDAVRTARIEQAVRQHAPALLGYFTRRVDEVTDAADLLGDTLVILWRRAGSLPAEDEEVRPWMFGIARNVLMHHQRRSVRQRALASRLRAALEIEPHPGFADPSEHDDLRRALASLDPVDRDIIGLIHWEGFSQIEVSHILRLNANTVRSRYHRSRLRLRTLLGDRSLAAPGEPINSS